MAGWLFVPPAERRLLAGERRLGPTTYVIAIMTFVMMLVAAAGLALSGTASLVARGIEHRYAVQVPDGPAVARVLAAARSAPGVEQAEAVPQAEIRATLERWLGPAGIGDLPVPALVTIDLGAAADPGAVARRIGQAVPNARFVAHEQTLQPLLRSLRVLQWLALTLVVLMAVATSAAVVLAARGALDTHRFTIEVMHGIGATDRQVTRLFQRSIAIDALVGAAAGGLGAALVLVVLGGGAGALAGDFAGRPPLAARDFLLLALLPLAAAALATWVARMAVLTALRRAV